MAEIRYRLTPNDYLMILRRRSALILSTLALFTLGALVVALTLPPVFRSTGLILVESSPIPEALVPVQSMGPGEARIQVISQHVMTQSNLLRIADKHRLYTEKGYSSSDRLEQVRASIELAPIRATLGGGGGTVAFELSFEHESPRLAQAVTSELVTLFLSENARIRQEQAQGTTAFLAGEAEKLQAELAELEETLASYKQKYTDALPEHLGMRMGMLQRTEAELNNVERESRVLEEDRRYLELELSAAQAGLGATSEQGQEPVSVEALKAEYDRLSQRFTDQHPDVQLVRRRLEYLELNGAGQAMVPLSESKLRVEKIQAQIRAADEQRTSLARQKDKLKKQLAELEGHILETPQVQRALTGIMRDYANAQSKYEEVKEKQIDARIRESLQSQNKAERLSLVEPPYLPEEPVRPQRKRIMLLGLLLAIASSGGLAAMAETLDQRLYGAGRLTHALGRRPLAVISYIDTPADARRKRNRRLVGLCLLLVSIAGAALLIHFLHTPLDLLVMNVFARFS